MITPSSADLAERLGAGRGFHRGEGRAGAGCGTCMGKTHDALRRQGLPRSVDFDTVLAPRARSLVASLTRTTAACCAPSATRSGTPPRCPRRAARWRSCPRRIAGFGYDDCPRPPGLAAADRGHRTTDHPAAARRQPAIDPAAQPTGFSVDYSAAHKHTRAPRWSHGSIRRTPPLRGIADRRYRPPVQRPRRLPGRGVLLSEAVCAGVVQLATGAWYDPETHGRGPAALRARQPQRADARHRHVAAGAGLQRPVDGGADGALRRQPAADPGLRPPRGRLPAPALAVRPAGAGRPGCIAPMAQ